MNIEELLFGHEDNVSEKRREALVLAIELGADDATLIVLRTVIRLDRSETVILPAHKFEGLSRGRGWARKGRGKNVTWGERVNEGYRVGPGNWVVGGNDGFSRKGETPWRVEHIKVGDQTWTTAE